MSAAETDADPIVTWEKEAPSQNSYAPWSRNPRDTPQAVSIIGFLLGCLFVLGVTQINSLPTYASLEPVGIWTALRSPQLGAYFTALAVFHMSEYLTTAIYNPDKVHVGCEPSVFISDSVFVLLIVTTAYLLHNGLQYHIAHTAGMIEYVLEEAYLPAPYRNFKHNLPMVSIGVLMVIVGQWLRSTAMITAASNFSHDVAFVKAEKHVLVTRGVYQYSRHPSYAAFFYWSVGTQVMCGNPICTLAFAYIVWNFFSQRILYEEKALVSFFGQDYVDYRRRVGTLIPLLK